MEKTELNIIEVIPDGIESVSNYCIFVIDKKGVVMSWNYGAEKITGYTKNEIIGSRFSKLYRNEDIKRFYPEKNIESAARSGCKESLGWRIKKDGSSFWVSETINVIKNNSNGDNNFIVIIRDITERKHAETLAREWLRVVEDSRVAIARLKYDKLEFKLINNAFAKMYGYSIEELKKLKLADLVPPEYSDQFFQNLKHTTENGHYLFESTHLHKDGTQFPVIVEGNVIKDQFDKVQHLLINVRNISEYKEIQRSFELSEEKFSQLFEQASEGIFIADINGTCTDANPAICNMLGYLKEDLIGKSIVDLMPPEENEKLIESRQLPLEPRKVNVQEWNMKKKDGTYLPVEINANILPDGRWQAFVRDITERKKIQEITKKSELRFRSLMEEAHDGIVIVNDKGIIEFANNNLKNWFGYALDEIVGKPLEILVPERYRAMHIGHRFQYMSNPTPRPMGLGIDLFAVRKDGSEFPVDISLSPIEVEGGTSVAAFIRDLSDRKRSEAQQKFLADSSNILSEEFHLENSLGRLADLITPFMADFCIIYYYENNKLVIKAISHTDRSMEDVLKKAAKGLFSTPETCPYRPEGSVDNQKAVLLSTITEPFLSTLSQSEEGLASLTELNPKSIILLPLVARKKTIGILFLGMGESGRPYSSTDLTFAELIATRIQIAIDNIVLYNEAQKATKARQDILAVVSHDLKNPLTVIKNGFEMISKLIKNNDLEKAQELLQSTNKSTAFIERLINDLLDFSKLQEGTFSIQQRPVVIKEIVIEAVSPFLNVAKEKSIDFSWDTPHADLIIECDPVRITQILMNIIGNAIKFTPANGKVNMKIIESENAVQFLVSDTGPGISEEELPHIFDRYWQVKGTAYLGTGLGLSIVKALVEAHNGKIWVRSKVNEGSTFCIEIPKKYIKKII